MQEDITDIPFGKQREAVELCESLRCNVGQVNSMLDLEVATPDVEECERRQLHLVTRDVIHQYFMFGFEVKQPTLLHFCHLVIIDSHIIIIGAKELSIIVSHLLKDFE